VLFHPGWSGIDPARLPPGVFVLGDTPHDWLFPRTALVVHHGGAGTSHAVARAGVPSVVVPFAGDQFFWARRMAGRGIATTCPAARLDGARLVQAIAAASAPGMRAAARRTAQAMRGEDGVRTAVDRLLGGAARRLDG
jgi:UDP:flavonoid glycosyltransferase YjiC (YdhE family)